MSTERGRAFLRDRPDGPFMLVDGIKVEGEWSTIAVKASSPSLEAVRAAARLLYPGEDPEMLTGDREGGYS